MAKSVPMVRAMALAPAVRWLISKGRKPDALLREVGLHSAAFGDPLRPISLFKAAALLKAIADDEGPDVPYRIVSEANLIELAMIGKVALGTTTPAETMMRISSALPLFCTHENVSVLRSGDQIVVRHTYLVRFEPETEHLMLQYAVAMADRICQMTETPGPSFKRVEILPHPDYGVSHLDPWLKGSVLAGERNGIAMWVESRVAERPYRKIARDRLAVSGPPPLAPLRGDGSFSSSARIMLTSMLEDGVPTLQQLSDVAETSVRTMQRWFKDEGTSFVNILDDVRLERAVRQIAGGDEAILSIATELGYDRQSSLTRAMRRWTGLSPREFRYRARS